MADIVYYVVVLVLFLACWGLLFFCARTWWRADMHPIYLIAGLISAGLLIYLLLAMLKPELFG